MDQTGHEMLQILVEAEGTCPVVATPLYRNVDGILTAIRMLPSTLHTTRPFLQKGGGERGPATFVS